MEFQAVSVRSEKLHMLDGEASLATRAAWLHFAAGLTQSEVASRLNIQSTKAHRLIARASREGMVRVFVEGPVAECVALENVIVATVDAQWKVRYLGQLIDERVLLTDVWVRVEDSWKVVRRHSSPVPPGVEIS